MNPLGNRAQVEALARLLEGGVSSSGSAAAPQVLLAMRLRALGATLDSTPQSHLVPRADFRTALRKRLVAVAQVQAAAAADAPFAEPIVRQNPLTAVTDAVSAWSQTSKAQRRLGVTAGAMAGVVAFTGVGMAASRALPGQAFYGLKRGAESIQLQLASGDQAKGSKHLEFAATRLREVKALADGDDLLSLGAPGTASAAGLAFGGSLQRRINDTLADFNAETSSGRMLLEGVYRQTGKQEPLRILKSFSAEQGSRLTALIPTLPAESLPVAQESLTLVKQVQTAATEQLALGICGGECFPGNAGPVLPTEPEPSPGVTASPTASNDNNGVGSCSCAPVPEPEPTESSSPEPASTPSETPSPTPSPTPEPTGSPGPLPLPLPLPLPVPTILPTLLPVPTLLPSLLPSLPIVNEPVTLPVLGTLP